MRVLLDTHVVLWWLSDDPVLGGTSRAAIADPQTQAYVSAATVWEIAIKQNLGKLAAPGDLPQQLERHRFEPLAVTVAHAYTAGFLPRHHDDPFDRMLVSQAKSEGLTLVTSDPRILLYEVPTLEAGI